MMIDDIFVDTDYVLSLVVVYQVQVTQRWDDIVFFDARYLTNFTVKLMKITIKIVLTTNFRFYFIVIWGFSLSPTVSWAMRISSIVWAQ